MDFSTILQAISAVGFPIVCCLCMGWYVKYITDKQRDETKQLNDNHTKEMMAFNNEIKEALNNNTIALNKLCAKLGCDDDGR